MNKARRIAVDGVLSALYFSLSLLTITSGNLQLRFTSLALLFAALFFGTADACAVALIGELLYQVILYGLSATTPIWLLPPVLHALLLGLMVRFVRAHVPEKKQNPALFVGAVLCGLCNALLNTAALYADSRIYGYFVDDFASGFWMLALLRLGIGALTAALAAAIAIPMIRILQRRQP